MSILDRIAEAWSHYRTLSPVVTRKTLRERERNAFDLGVDYGAHTGLDSSHFSRNQKPRHLKAVSA